MKSKNVLNLLRFGELLVNARIAYNNAKADPETAKTTTTFGKRSLTYFFWFVALAAVAGWLIYFCVTHIVSSLVLIAIGAAVLSVYIVLYSLGLLVLSLNLAIKQVRLNKKPVGIVALVLNLLVITIVLLAIVALIVILKINS